MKPLSPKQIKETEMRLLSLSRRYLEERPGKRDESLAEEYRRLHVRYAASKRQGTLT